MSPRGPGVPSCAAVLGPRPRPRSSPVVVALAAAASVLLASCGLLSSSSPDDPNAASVDGGVTITRDELEDELDVIRSNDGFRETLESSYGVALEGTGKGSDNTAFVARVLTYDLYYALIEDELERRGIEITEAVVEEAKDRLASDPGEEIMDALPDSYQETLVHREAMLLSLIDATGAPYEPSKGEEYFNAHREEFDSLCFSHILVSTDDLSDSAAEEAATALSARLAEGADFAALASTESDDTTSAEQNGEVGCYTLASGDIDTEFMTGALQATVGEVTEPVRSQYGYHLILVTSRTPATDYASAESDVSTRLDDLGREAYNDALLEAICPPEVTVNSRYGTWDDSACTATGAEKGLALVEPPPGTAAPTTTTTASQ